MKRIINYFKNHYYKRLVIKSCLAYLNNANFKHPDCAMEMAIQDIKAIKNLDAILQGKA